MTADGLAEKPASLDGAAPLTVPATLSLCDRLLGEFGRRGHMFAWLRGVDGWLPVDAYYPGHRLVVVCSSEGLVSEQAVREHGLRLMRIAPGELGRDLHSAERALSWKLKTLGPAQSQLPVPVERRRA